MKSIMHHIIMLVERLLYCHMHLIVKLSPRPQFNTKLFSKIANCGYYSKLIQDELKKANELAVPPEISSR